MQSVLLISILFIQPISPHSVPNPQMYKKKHLSDLFLIMNHLNKIVN